MNRFYHSDDIKINELIQLNELSSNHISRVLRMKEGDDLIIFNGDENKATEDIILSKTGLDFLGRIPNMNTIDKDSIQSMAQHFKHLKS